MVQVGSEPQSCLVTFIRKGVMDSVTIRVPWTMLAILVEINLTCLRKTKKPAKLCFYLCMSNCHRERLTLEINELERMSVLTSVSWLHPILYEPEWDSLKICQLVGTNCQPGRI